MLSQHQARQLTEAPLEEKDIEPLIELIDEAIQKAASDGESEIKLRVYLWNVKKIDLSKKQMYHLKDHYVAVGFTWSENPTTPTTLSW